jgi:hypothetical protein
VRGHVESGAPSDAPEPESATTVHTLRAALPKDTLVGGSAVESVDLQHLLTQKNLWHRRRHGTRLEPPNRQDRAVRTSSTST